jgi:hypothetical protein
MEIKCAACGATKNTRTPPMEFICKDCGCINVTEIKEEGGRQACSCLLPTTFEWTLPVGRIGNPISGYKYVSPSGTIMTREQWLKAWSTDPEIALQWMRSGGAEKLRDDDIDIGGGWRNKKGRKPIVIGGNI